MLDDNFSIDDIKESLQNFFQSEKPKFVFFISTRRLLPYFILLPM
jgi:hypothetical protein